MIQAKILRVYRETITESLSLLDARDRRKIFLISIGQTISAFLDLAGIAFFGLLGAMAIKGIQSQSPNKISEFTFSALHLDHLSFQAQTAFVGVLAGGLLISKTMLSVLMTKKTFNFLSYKCSVVASQTTSKLFALPLLAIRRKSSQSIIYSITSGITNLIIGVIGSLAIVIADLSLLVTLFMGMIFFDVVLAVSTLSLFLLVAFFLHLTLGKKAKNLGAQSYDLAVSCNQEILEGLNSFRELFVKNQRQMYVERIRENRTSWSKISSDLNFLPYISKYVIESTVLIGGLLVGAIQFAIYDASHAAASLSIFLAAGSRIAPAVLRIQQSLIQMKVYVSSSGETIKLIHELGLEPEVVLVDPENEASSDIFEPSIECKNLNYSYPESHKPALTGINFKLDQGKSLAIVGKSGSGKTTLVDILLGIIKPSEGNVRISGNAPEESIKKWPGLMAYVPQDVYVADGSVRENVTLGYESSSIPDDLIWDALKAAHLSDFVSGLPEGILSSVGENGSNLSGGQKQRLGIARALLTRPKLLVLDEATSALDSETESAISESILRLSGRTTIVIIAHRLSTVQNVDNVLYLDNGRVIGLGDFKSVRAAVPDFEFQAQLMGL